MVYGTFTDAPAQREVGLIIPVVIEAEAGTKMEISSIHIGGSNGLAEVVFTNLNPNIKLA